MNLIGGKWQSEIMLGGISKLSQKSKYSWKIQYIVSLIHTIINEMKDDCNRCLKNFMKCIGIHIVELLREMAVTLSQYWKCPEKLDEINKPLEGDIFPSFKEFFLD